MALSLSLRLRLTTSTIVAGGGGSGPILSNLVVDGDAGTVSIEASEAGTMYWQVDDTASYADADAMIAAAGSAEASGNYAISAGTNSDTLDTSGVSAGDHYIHFGMLNGSSVASNVLSELETFAGSSSYTHTPRFDGSTALTHSISNILGTTDFGASGFCMGCLVYYDGSNWDGRLFSISNSGSASNAFAQLNNGNCTFKNGNSDVNTSPAATPASTGWYQVMLRVTKDGATTEATFYRSDISNVSASESATSGTDSDISGFNSLNIGRSIQKTGTTLYSASGKVASPWIGLGDPSGLMTWWKADKTRDPNDYDDSSDANFSFLHGWDCAADGTTFADLTMTDRHGSLNSWSEVGTLACDTPAPPYA